MYEYLHKLSHYVILLVIMGADILVVHYEYRSVDGKCNYVQPKATWGGLQDLQR